MFSLTAGINKHDPAMAMVQAVVSSVGRPDVVSLSWFQNILARGLGKVASVPWQVDTEHLHQGKYLL